MSADGLESRRARREAARELARLEPKPNYAGAERRSRRIRQGAFGLAMAVVVMSFGLQFTL